MIRIVALLLAMTAAANAQNLWSGRGALADSAPAPAITPQDFMVLLDSMDIQAQIIALPEGRDPRTHALAVTANTDGLYWDAVFYNCGVETPDENGAAQRIALRPVRGCRDFALSAGFSLEYPVSVQTINRFNREHRFARATLSDEGAPIISMDVNLEGGVSRRALEVEIGAWRALLLSFSRYVGY